MPPGKNRRNPGRFIRIGRSPIDRPPQLSTARRPNGGMRLQRCSYRGCPPTFDLRYVACEFGGSCTCTQNKFRSSNTLRSRREGEGNVSWGVPLSPSPISTFLVWRTFFFARGPRPESVRRISSLFSRAFIKVPGKSDQTRHAVVSVLRE